MSLKALITGGDGQLGCSLKQVLTPSAGYDAVFASRTDLDITDAEAVERAIAEGNYDIIVNCAAFTNVDAAESHREEAMRVNAEAPRLVAEAAARHSVKMIHISTDYVFDGAVTTPYREDDIPHPLSVYGESKLAGERSVLLALNDAIVIRTSWLYAPHRANFVSAIVRRAELGTSLKVVDDQVGSPTFAPDLAEAIARIIAHRRWVSGIYHFSDKCATSRFDFAREILWLAGKSEVELLPVKSEEYPTPALRPSYSVLSTEKIERTYGIEPPQWRDSLAKYFNELYDNDLNNDH